MKVRFPITMAMSGDVEITRSPESGGRLLLAAALAMTVLTYVGTLHFGFVYDDGPQIIANPTLTSWRFLPWLFTGQTWKFLGSSWAGNYYRPLFMSWLLANRMLFGLNPVAWHASTLAVHLLATWLAFVVARRILKSGTEAGFVALLFGVHPIHIESVAWISGITDPLMAVFVFSAFWAWMRAQEGKGKREFWLVVSAVLYLLGCLSKETALPLLVVIILYDLWFGESRSVLRATVRTWPLCISAVAYLVIRSLALSGLMHTLNTPMREVLLSIPIVLWEYGRRLIWPLGLSVFYDIFPVTSTAQIRFWLPLAGLIVAAVLAWWATRRQRIFRFSLAWVVLFLSPAILGLPVFLSGEWVHDRYLYLPSFGLCLVLGYASGYLPSRRKIFGYPAVAMATVMVLAAAMSFATSWQEQYWNNSVLLFVRAVNEAPNNAWARATLAGELFRTGDRVNARRMYEEALRVDPDNWKNNADFGNMLYRVGDYREADVHYTRALAGVPGDPTAHFNQGMSRINYGNYAGAEQSFEETLRLNPKEPQAHYWLGDAFEEQGKIQSARCEYEAEIQAHSEKSADARQRLAALSDGTGKNPNSCAVRN